MTSQGAEDRHRRVLLVEEGRADAEAVADRLETGGCQVSVVRDAAAANLIVGDRGCDVLICPLDMPGTNGRALHDEVLRLDPSLAVVVSAPPDDIPRGAEALKMGVEDVVLRPLVPEQVEIYVERAFSRRQTVIENGHAEGLLRDSVQEKTRKLRLALTEMQGTFNATVEAMVSAVEARDCETQHHCRRAREYSLLLGREMGLDGRDLRDLAWGALLHDVGKIGVPDHILLKTGPLSSEEWSLMRLHPLIGYRLLAPVHFLNGAATVVLSHHEKWDGTGYPYGKLGEDIPLTARIFMVADAFETITSRRSYKEALPFGYAEEEIVSSAGSHFDPRVVEAFQHIGRDEWMKIRNRYLDEIKHGRTIVEERTSLAMTGM
jgi:response regulator RpfG family c-di-GMP phosphodiesterase